jgi:hypothetical protein
VETAVRITIICISPSGVLKWSSIFLNICFS